MRRSSAILVLTFAACARPTASGPPAVRATPPPEHALANSTGRVVSLPIPPGFDREVRYLFQACRAKCGTAEGDWYALDVKLDLELPKDCLVPDPQRPQFPDLVQEQSDQEDPDPPDTTSDEDEGIRVLEFRPVELLGMRGTLLSRHARDKGSWFEAGALGRAHDVDGQRRVECLAVHFSPYASDGNASAAFRTILASLSPEPSASAPEGFSRFPFAAGQIDVPDGVPLSVLSMSGAEGSLEVESYGRTSHGNLSKHFERNYAYEKPELLEPHSSRPYLDGTVEQARARLTVSGGERRIAVVRRPQRKLLIFNGKVNSPSADGAPLDAKRWTELIERLVPLFHSERAG